MSEAKKGYGPLIGQTQFSCVQLIIWLPLQKTLASHKTLANLVNSKLELRGHLLSPSVASEKSCDLQRTVLLFAVLLGDDETHVVPLCR